MKKILFLLLLICNFQSETSAQKPIGSNGRKLVFTAGFSSGIKIKEGLGLTLQYKSEIGHITSRKIVNSICFNYSKTIIPVYPLIENYTGNFEGLYSSLFRADNSDVKINSMEFIYQRKKYIIDDLAPIGRYFSYGFGVNYIHLETKSLYGEFTDEYYDPDYISHYFSDYVFKSDIIKTMVYTFGYGKSFALNRHFLMDIGFNVRFSFANDNEYDREYSSEFRVFEEITRREAYRYAYVINFKLSFLP